MKELEYYEQIASFLKDEMQASLSGLGKFLVEFQPCGNTDLSFGLQQVLRANPIIKDKSLQDKMELTRGLYVDILGIVYSKSKQSSELIICEVKKHNLTLTDHAQLIGYCIASNIRNGILISLGGRITGGFESILKNNPSLLNIHRKKIVHRFGICSWSPKSKELLFDQIGAFNSLEALCRYVAFVFEEVS